MSREVVPQYARESKDRVLRVLDRSGITRISALSLSGVQAALADIRRQKGRKGREHMSEANVRYYVRSIKSFSRWVWRDGRAREDPLVHLPTPEVNDAQPRRAFNPDEAAALIATTPSLPRRASLDGPDRAILYATATGTGLRLGELSSLTPDSFHLDAVPPATTCRAQYTKNGKEAIQPIRPELAEMLRPWLASKLPGTPVFPVRGDDAADALRLDLEAAGVADSSVYDFHCLRHTYITMLVKSGASVKVCQELARHSDPKLTMNLYTHLTVHDTSKGLEGLSHILPTKAVSKGLTGTDGNVAISSPGETGTVPSRHENHRVKLKVL
jgi:integrase